VRFRLTQQRMTTARVGAAVFPALIGAALLAALAAPSQAADLGVGPHHGKRVRTAWVQRDWRERCAHAGYYCLYAEYGFVYHYPYDDRPIAHGHRRWLR
jgi:hypothetical protein